MLPTGFIFFQRDWLSSNSLLISDSNSSYLFDSGYVTHSDQLLQLVRHELGSQPLDVLINTHLHSDHCGGNALLQSHFPQMECLIPDSQFQAVTEWQESSLTYALTGQSCDRFTPTRGVTPGNQLSMCGLDWQIYSSPGHDNDSLIYFQPDHRILVSADALWENGFSVVFPEFIGGVGFDNVASTYDLIASLNPSLVIPGHGSMFKDAQKALDISRRRLDQFMINPSLHATYAAKVMVKFKMMEFKKCHIASLLNWARDSSLLSLLHKNYFDGNFDTWITKIINDLLDRKALVQSGDLIFDS
jgi:glyoxylase-like metal-dependent hydrolase (beta-lactamase superfamily II)